MIKLLLFVTFMVYVSAERISHVEPVSWNRHTTTEDYYSGRGSSYGNYDENVRGTGSSSRDRYGSSVTDRPGSRYTYSWERDTTQYGRSSYLDRHTTYSPYGSSYDRDTSYDRHGSGSYGSYTSRRPSYQTDRWGDAIGATTRSYSSSWSSDRDSSYGSGSSGSRYGSSITTRSWLDSSYSGGMYGSSRDRDTHSSSGHGSSSTRYDRNNAYVRILIELAKLTNDQGFEINGKKCDTWGKCDPIVSAYIDTDRPNADFPGTVEPKYWPVIFQTDDNNSPDFTRANLTREICGTPYRSANLRVYIEDSDTGKNDVINKFDCDITREPDSSETMATWHTGSCTSRATNADAKKMRLSFRYKVFVIPSYRCDSTIGQIRVAGGTTPKPARRH